MTGDRPIIEVLDRLVGAWNRGDIDVLLSAYWSDGAVRYAAGSEVIHGFSAIEQRFHDAYPDPAAMGTLTFSGLEIARPAESDAVVFGRWRIEREAEELNGLFTVHLRFMAGDWVIVSDHTSAD